MTKIELITKDDFAEWLILWHGYLDFYQHPLSDEQTELTFERLLNGNDGMYGAIARDSAGRAVGMVNWLRHASTWSKNGYCYLEDLFVSSDQRGAGVGRALIQFVIDWSAAEGLHKVHWLTAYTNKGAQALYNKMATTEMISYSTPTGK
jgi:GNAT superfamily N-acetyltransferase